MNGLEALNRLYGFCIGTNKYYKQFLSSKEPMEQDKDSIEKELEAFEIIKAKKVETYHLSRCKTLIEYNSAWDIGGMDLTQDEFDLLKEVMKC